MERAPCLAGWLVLVKRLHFPWACRTDRLLQRTDRGRGGGVAMVGSLWSAVSQYGLKATSLCFSDCGRSIGPASGGSGHRSRAERSGVLVGRRVGSPRTLPPPPHSALTQRYPLLQSPSAHTASWGWRSRLILQGSGSQGLALICFLLSFPSHGPGGQDHPGNYRQDC